jgi:stress response protein SCP2
MRHLAMGSHVALDARAVRAHVTWTHTTPVDVRVVAVVTGAQGQVRDRTDLVTPDSPVHPSGAVRLSGATVDVALDTLPAGAGRVLVALSVRGGTCAALTEPSLRVEDAESGDAVAAHVADEAAAARTLVLGEVYRRTDGWRLRAVGQGYAGGDAGLGADVGLPPDAWEVPPSERDADPGPRRVVLCLDHTSSMRPLHRTGGVAAALRHVLAVDARLGGTGAVDTLLFGAHVHDAGAVTPDNVAVFARRLLRRRRLEHRTRAGAALRLAAGPTPGSGGRPLGIVLTDGEPDDPDDVADAMGAGDPPAAWRVLAVRHAGTRTHAFPTLTRLTASAPDAALLVVDGAAGLTDAALPDRVLASSRALRPR